jgi:hypothetical protein
VHVVWIHRCCWCPRILEVEYTDFGGVAYHESRWGMLPGGEGLSRCIGVGRLPLAGADAGRLPVDLAGARPHQKYGIRR